MGGYSANLPWASCGNKWNNNLTCVDVDRTKVIFNFYLRLTYSLKTQAEQQTCVGTDQGKENNILIF
jgi:hypothetical protein